MPRPSFSPAARGLTRLELLVLIVALVVLVAMGAGPVLAYLKKTSIANAVENAHTISVVLGQYATDNNDVYPVGEGTPVAGTSEGIARNLLENSYTPDATLFAVGSTPSYHGSAHDYSDLAAQNLSWDFTAGANAMTGITADAPASLPVVFTTGEKVNYAGEGVGLSVALNGPGPFGHRGMIVAYKANNAAFLPTQTTGDSAGGTVVLAPNFKATGTYTQVRP